MKHNLVTAALLGALACSGLFAQTGVRANIPFEFHAGDIMLPAGDYTIRQDGPWVILSTDAGKPATALMTNSAAAQDAVARGAHLEFHRYGSEFFLAAVYDGYSGVGRELPPASREKELVKLARRGNGQSQGTITIASR